MTSRSIRAEHGINHLSRIIPIVATLFAGVWASPGECAQKAGFFASQSLSRASSVAGSDSWRISQGPTPPATKGRRPHADRSVPINQQPGLREFDTNSKFNFSRDFRNFGIQRRGAIDSPGAPDARPQ
jgi:hypothetical protein